MYAMGTGPTFLREVVSRTDALVEHSPQPSHSLLILRRLGFHFFTRCTLRGDKMPNPKGRVNVSHSVLTLCRCILDWRGAFLRGRYEG
jgi:hypothetical protein